MSPIKPSQSYIHTTTSISQFTTGKTNTSPEMANTRDATITYINNIHDQQIRVKYFREYSTLLAYFI